MSMFIHIGKICSMAFHGLYKIRQIQGNFLVLSLQRLLFTHVWHLDYFKSLLFSVPKYQTDRLQ